MTTTPRNQLIAVSLFVCAALWAAVWLALDAPWLGIQFAPGGQDNGLRISKTEHASPAAKSRLQSDTLVYAIGNGTLHHELNRNTLLEEPDYLIPYPEFNHFFAEQALLWQILNSPAITLETSRGIVQLQPESRPLRALPAVFWFQLFCGGFAALTGVAVFAFRRENPAAAYYAITGLAFLLITYTAAIYSGRELALPGELFRNLSALDHLGTMLFDAAFVALFWHYPRRIHPFPLPALLFTLYPLIWVLDTLQWLPSTDWGIRLPTITGLGLCLLIAVFQWRASARHPEQRVILKWFLLALLLAGSTFVLAIFVVVWLGGTPLISQGYAFGVVLLMYLGIALGILKYRLFDLDRWWVEIWLWLLGGAAFIALDMLLIYVLNLNASLTMAVTLALAGWLYFPARQWLLYRLFPGQSNRLESVFPDLLKLLLVSNDDASIERRWRDLLRRLYSPLDMQETKHNGKPIQRGDDGLVLIIPSTMADTHLALHHADRGRRLFNQRDMALAESLWTLLRQALQERALYQQGINTERQRIARDLHDDIGTRLLTLVHRSNDSPLAELARDALRDLRSVVSNLDGQATNFEDLAADMRSEAEQRCEAAGCQLHWCQSENFSGIGLDARQHSNLQRLLREALTNALRHGAPETIMVDIYRDDRSLRIRVENDGRAIDRHRFKPGRGITNMQRRAEELNGVFTLDTDRERGAMIHFEMSIEEMPACSAD